MLNSDLNPNLPAPSKVEGPAPLVPSVAEGSEVEGSKVDEPVKSFVDTTDEEGSKEPKPIAQSLKKNPAHAFGMLAVLVLLGIAITGTFAAGLMGRVEKEVNDNTAPSVQGTSVEGGMKDYTNNALNISFKYPQDWNLNEQGTDQCEANATDCPQVGMIQLNKGDNKLAMLISRGPEMMRNCKFPDSILPDDKGSIVLPDSVELNNGKNQLSLRRNVNPVKFDSINTYFVCEEAKSPANLKIFVLGKGNISQIVYNLGNSNDTETLGILDQVVLSIGPVTPQ